MKKKIKNKKRGFMMAEVLIAVAIITISVLSAMAVAHRTVALSYQSVHTAQANFLLEEGAEGVRILRDLDWNNINNLNPGEDYYLIFSENNWILTNSLNQIGKFTRKINIENVNRDINTSDISTNGNNDPKTKLINISVSWFEGNKNITKNLSFYLMDIFS